MLDHMKFKTEYIKAEWILFTIIWNLLKLVIIRPRYDRLYISTFFKNDKHRFCPPEARSVVCERSCKRIIIFCRSVRLWLWRCRFDAKNRFAVVMHYNELSLLLHDKSLTFFSLECTEWSEIAFQITFLELKYISIYIIIGIFVYIYLYM